MGIIKPVENELLKISNKFKPLPNLIRKDGCTVEIKFKCKKFTHRFSCIDLDSSELKIKTTRCDYLIFADHGNQKDSWIIVLELKDGRVDISKVLKQLQGGVIFAKKIFDKNKNNVTVNFCPYVFFRGSDKYQKILLKKKYDFNDLNIKQSAIKKFKIERVKICKNGVGKIFL